MDAESWRWLSYYDAFWDWPVDDVGEEYFTNDEALDQAIFDVAVRGALNQVQRALPEWRDTRLLRLIRELRHALDNVQADLVAETRVQGVSWTRIGSALLVGRTAAQKRYGEGLSRERKIQLEKEIQAATAWARDEADVLRRSGTVEDRKFMELLDDFIAGVSERRGTE